jgi:hypothetical protein
MPRQLDQDLVDGRHSLDVQRQRAQTCGVELGVRGGTRVARDDDLVTDVGSVASRVRR